MTYTASPFFNPFEIKVKKDMIENIKKKLDEDIFDPESTDTSDNYGVAGSNAKGGDRFSLAKQIFKDNIEGIEKSDKLVFPKWTTDAGTNFEIGYAIGKGKKVFRYNHLSENIEPVKTEWKGYDVPKSAHIHIETVQDTVIFGFLSAKGWDLTYSLAGLKDNLMLAANYKYRTVDGLVIKPEDRNWEEGIQ